MNRATTYVHEFVEYIPDQLADGVLYISVTYATVAHKCMCGCGNKIVTPLSPRGWSMTFNGAAVSLRPSIGNGSYPCQSHYWLEDGRVDWLRRLTTEQIREARTINTRRDAQAEPPARQAREGLLKRFRRALRRQ